VQADLSIARRCVISQRLVKSVDGKRVAAVEVMLNTKHIQELIKAGEISKKVVLKGIVATAGAKAAIEAAGGSIE
jgi:Tfp pilus assembly ATPase PilU